MMDKSWIILCTVLIYSSSAQDEEKKNTQIRHACWDSRGPPVLSAQCPRDTAIHVTRAGLKMANHAGSYDKCLYHEDDCGCLYGEAGCNMSDPRKACMGRPACRLDVTVQYIRTEKCSGFTNYMFIEFECVPLGKTSIESICSNTEADAEFGYIKGPGALSVDGRTQCDCTLTTSPYSEMSVSLLDYHSGTFTCSQENLVVQYGRNAQQFCSDRYEGGQKISAGVNKVSLTFTTAGKKEAGSFWLKYQAEPPAAIKVQCAYTVEPKTTKKPSRKTPKPVPRIPPTTAASPVEPIEPEVLEIESEITHGSDNDVITEDPTVAPKLNDDITRSTPWWWRFTLKHQNQNTDSATTTFPPWFKEVEATEFPAWIKKTVTPKNNAAEEKEKIIKRIRMHSSIRNEQQKLLETEKLIGDENELDTKTNRKDLVHGNDIYTGPHQEIQIPRNFRLPQQNLPSKYHASRHPGKLKPNPKSDSSRSNFTIPLQNSLIRAKTRKTKAPNNVHEIVYTVGPTDHSDIDLITKPPSFEKVNEDDTEATVVEIVEDNDRNKNSNVDSVSVTGAKLSAKVSNRLNRQRTFLNKVRRQKNMWNRLRSNRDRSTIPREFYRQRDPYERDRISEISDYEEDNNEYDYDDADENYPHERRYYKSFDKRRNDDRHYPMKDENTYRENMIEYEVIRDQIEPHRDDSHDNDIETQDINNLDTGSFNNGQRQKTNRPVDRTRRKRKRITSKKDQNTKFRRQKGDLRNKEEFSATVTPDDLETFSLLPNSRVTQIADVFRPNTINTVDLLKMFKPRKTQFTLLEPTPPGWSKPPLSNSKFVHSLHDNLLPPNGEDSNNMKPSSLLPYSIPVLSTSMSKTSATDVNKSAKNKTHGSESIASRSRASGEMAKLPGLPYSAENSIRKGESTTATIIAACVIGSILLIVIIGIVVRFVINRADPNHSIRQHHKKECVVRRNQRERGKSYA